MVIVFITKTTSRQNNLRGESLDSERKKKTIKSMVMVVTTTKSIQLKKSA